MNLEYQPAHLQIALVKEYLNAKSATHRKIKTSIAYYLAGIGVA